MVVSFDGHLISTYHRCVTHLYGSFCVSCSFRVHERSLLNNNPCLILSLVAVELPLNPFAMALLTRGVYLVHL
jgi:hypothetical protein